MSTKDDILERLSKLPGVQCVEIDELQDWVGDGYNAILVTGRDPEGLTYTVAVAEWLAEQHTDSFWFVASKWMRETGRAWQ